MNNQNPPTFLDDPAVVTTAINRVKKTFATGKTRPYAFRLKQLQALEQQMVTMHKELSQARTNDLGLSDFCNWIFELNTVIRDIQHCIVSLKENMQADCVDTPMLIGPGKSYIIREPLGVVAIIGSWNYPFVTTISPMANAIAAGNTVVLKPSELSPFSAKIIKTLIAMSIDSSCYQCVFGHIKVAIALTSSPVDKIIFTGSTEKGRLVAAAAAKNLVPCILELGGKSPMIVDKSANLEYAAQKSGFASFLNSGQTCIRPDYILIQSSLVTQFVPHLETVMESMYKGGKDKESLGNVINDFHRDRICTLLADHGGTVLIGNANAHEDKNLTPTVILNPLQTSPIMKEEIFGPILPIITYNTIEDAIKFINERDKPLAIYYFGSNSDRNSNLIKVQEQTSSGSFVVNEVIVQMLSSHLPFGGVGASGYGRLHGKQGFDECSNLKSVLRKHPMAFYPFDKTLPPFKEGNKIPFLKFLIKYVDVTQAQLFKRMMWFAAAIWFVWMIASKRITMKKIRKVKGMLVMLFQMMRG